MQAIDAQWVWTWSGRFFGYWEGIDLWTHGGQHVGRRDGNDVFGPTGLYLGEVMGNQRLITNNSKAADRGGTFQPSAHRDAQLIRSHDLSLTLYLGYQDFPLPDHF
ncbi:MAG TPA: hypothetical protein VGM16_02615 [Gammaproteobacteria bacterium]|jgi:hypothetical protein